MNLLLVLSVLVATVEFVACTFGFRDLYKVKPVPLEADQDPGDPLILTPLLDQGLIIEARNLSEVPKEHFLGIESYAGYFTVDEEHNSNSFFWFFPSSETNYKNSPVLLWLQGGPGGASTYATFTENGPFEMIGEKNIKLRNTTWTAKHSVLYIDNPVGTGFSFTNKGWCSSEEEIGEHLYRALIQFFQLFPELQNNDFFVTGESYAGKYIPAVSYTIHRKNQESEQKINLKGLAIGNGLSDPIHQLNYGDYLYQNGLIDFNAREIMKNLEAKVVELVKAEKYDEAFEVYDTILNGDLTKYPTAFKNATGFDYYYNYLKSKGSIDDTYSVFIQQCHIRKALHVGNMSAVSDDEVESYLKRDFLISVAPWVSELLSHYRVLTYNGQLDIIVAYPLTVNYLRNLNFSASEEYKTAKRYEWKVDDEIAGYVKQAGNLTEVLVRNAGHMVPSDQPVWTLDLISKFVRNIPLH
ncbi:venom serine carboxypeptidase-like [Coccinella septempunctata]|uniref:venom serine carboxypeptidase-like n=1 Tax=Coccinella septempunctata TaxID=41139 RepID=UPI001D07EEE8|nr:venom serine carboxypeptidase-like [Coccinella septempunctata]